MRTSFRVVLVVAACLVLLTSSAYAQRDGVPTPQGVSDLAVGFTDRPEPDLVWLAAIVVAAVSSGAAMRLRLRQSITAVEDVVEAGL
jgi:hypothetical protein